MQNDWIRFETCTIFRNASQNHAGTAKWMTRYTDISEDFQEVQSFL